MIPDTHVHWVGLKPVLFSLYGLPVTSYALFMVLGVAAAVLFYCYQSRALGSSGPHSWTLILSALFFGSLGAKLTTFIWYSGQCHPLGFIQFLYAGRSIVGGLIGGWAGVKLTKRVLGISGRYGNTLAPAAALGIAIGRLGCFLASCCYGKPTECALGIDFGDGQRRHPTQLYEAVFALGLFLYLAHANTRRPAPGVLFKRFLLAYFAFRFVIEFIRTEPVCWLGLTIYQLLSLFVIGLVCGQAVWAQLRQRTEAFKPH
jgi:phosphatidylglycerol---prolipoprotein diacylglyceryl transferase